MTPPTDDRFATDDDISTDGRGLELPEQCVGFVVRCWPEGARGAGELVIDERLGAQPLGLVAVRAIADAVRLGSLGVGKGLPS